MLRSTLVPLMLLITTPALVGMMWISIEHFDGSFSALLMAMQENPMVLVDLWPSLTMEAFKIIFVLAAFEAVLLQVLPGEDFLGPITPMGVRPKYKLNGVSAFIVSHLVYAVGLLGVVPGFEISKSLVYDNFGSILVVCTVYSFLFCVFVYFKGIYFPSSPDHGSSGNPVWDFYWGTELHPRLFGVNLKQFVNCRLSMMSWSLIGMSCLSAQYAKFGFVSSSMIVSYLLLHIYLFKFFVWESGYFTSMDIAHDRFGYYICWGVCSWVPSLYCIAQLYLVNHPIHEPEFSTALAAFNVFVGVLAIYINYDADRQRQLVRATQGKCTVWGKPPSTIEAKYTTGDGKTHRSLLVYSGWWGVARHFHYVPEILAAFSWSAPALYTGHVLPFFYVIFLTMLLLDRTHRDEVRCSKKYGTYWNQYKKQVPYRMIPYVY